MKPHEREAVFHLFERFPDDDAYGIFWSLIYNLEKQPGYEKELLASIQRRPTEFNIEMVARIIRGGFNEKEGTDLVGAIQSAVDKEPIPSKARTYASETLARLALARRDA